MDSHSLLVRVALSSAVRSALPNCKPDPDPNLMLGLLGKLAGTPRSATPRAEGDSHHDFLYRSEMRSHLSSLTIINEPYPCLSPMALPHFGGIRCRRHPLCQGECVSGAAARLHQDEPPAPRHPRLLALRSRAAGRELQVAGKHSMG